MEQKRKIIICSHALCIGGAERSLLDMLYCLNYKRMDVDLFLYRHDGEWMNRIPKQVELLPESPQYSCLAIPMVDVLRKKQLLVLFGRMLGKILADRYDRKHQLKDSAVGLEYSHKYTARFMPMIQPEKEYDLAISFLTPHYYVAKKVKAKRKIAWIHTDYSAISVNEASELKMWQQYNNIVSISEKVTESFLKKFPSLSDKVVLIENVLAESLVRAQSEQNVLSGMLLEEGVIRLLSIGRYSYPKNFDQVPEICARILSMGCKIKWYLIGYGDDKIIRDNCKKFGVEGKVILLGKKENPYPYIKACDIYVQPSRYEGKAVTVREAQMLHKPVVITAFATAESQLENRVDGLIVPLDNEGCARGICNLIRDTELKNHLIENTYKRNYGNQSGLRMLYSLME